MEITGCPTIIKFTRSNLFKGSFYSLWNLFFFIFSFCQCMQIREMNWSNDLIMLWRKLKFSPNPWRIIAGVVFSLNFPFIFLRSWKKAIQQLDPTQEDNLSHDSMATKLNLSVKLVYQVLSYLITFTITVFYFSSTKPRSKKS